VIAMRAVSKFFIGDIIEGALRVQGEWIKKGEKQTDLPEDQIPFPIQAQSSSQADSSAQATPGAASEAATQEQQSQPQQQKAEDRRGPLRPDHMREAIRRYRVSGEGGGVGMQSVFHQQQ
jgi:transcription initiation factor TFIID subunit 11